MRSRTTLWLKVAVHVAGWAPLAAIGWAYWQGQLGADPIGLLTRRTGRWAIVFVLLSLLPTFVRVLTGFRGLLPVRRALGLYGFLYAGLHFLVFVGLDYGFDISLIWGDVRQDRRVIAGLVAGLILLPLALTSTRGWIKRLGKNWRRLHRFVYLAALLAVLHYAWTFKELRVAPVLAGVVLLLLLAVRLPPVARLLERSRSAS